MRNALWMYLFNSGETYFRESGCQKKHWFRVHFRALYLLFVLCTHNANQQNKRNCVQHFSQYTVKWVNGLLLIAAHNDCLGKGKTRKICIVYVIQLCLLYLSNLSRFFRSFVRCYKSVFAFLGIVSGSCRWFYSFTWNRQDRELTLSWPNEFQHVSNACINVARYFINFWRCMPAFKYILYIHFALCRPTTKRNQQQEANFYLVLINKNDQINILVKCCDLANIIIRLSE